MTLQARLLNDLKEAMRQRDEVRLSVLRMLRSAIHYEEIARGGPLDDDGVLAVVSRQIRQRRESIAAFRDVQRQDRAAQEEAERAILEQYLPQQLSREEIVDLARRAIQEVGAQGPKDQGKVMGRLMPQVRGRAEGSAVSEVVKTLLQGSPES